MELTCICAMLKNMKPTEYCRNTNHNLSIDREAQKSWDMLVWLEIAQSAFPVILCVF